MDGEVVGGRSAVDESMVTGEWRALSCITGLAVDVDGKTANQSALAEQTTSAIRFVAKYVPCWSELEQS